MGIVFIGGLIDHDTVYARILREKISAKWPPAKILAPMYPPVRGALILAQQKLDVR